MRPLNHKGTEHGVEKPQARSLILRGKLQQDASILPKHGLCVLCVSVVKNERPF